TMGNMQGMMKAAKPPSSPAMKMPQSDCDSSCCAASTPCMGAPAASLPVASASAVPSPNVRSSGTSKSVSPSEEASPVSDVPSVNSISSNGTNVSASCAVNKNGIIKANQMSNLLTLFIFFRFFILKFYSYKP